MVSIAIYPRDSKTADVKADNFKLTISQLQRLSDMSIKEIKLSMRDSHKNYVYNLIVDLPQGIKPVTSIIQIDPMIIVGLNKEVGESFKDAIKERVNIVEMDKLVDKITTH